ncbi:MAG TPA: hypothetical protein VK171_03575 [Fimbriimonas sp.]|nr:hypothetical protein [Fimbriimonas sp.]
MSDQFNSPEADDVQTDDIDALYDSIVSPNGDGPSGSDLETAAATEPVAPQAAKAPAQPHPEQEYEYTYSGQKIKAPLSEILRKASMGHDYAQQMGRLKQERTEWERERSLSEKLKEEYAPIDEWVRSNPDKWERLQAAINAEKNGYGDIDPNHPILQKYQALEKLLNERVLPTIEETQQEKIRLKHDAEDKELDQEIQSIRESYKDLDWGQVDANGRSEKEIAVLKHASANGFKTFRAAFLDLYHDDIVKRAEERGKTSIANDRLKNAKTGLLGKTQAPVTGVKKATNIKNKSYSDLAQEGLEEFGISRG